MKRLAKRFVYWRLTAARDLMRRSVIGRESRKRRIADRRERRWCDLWIRLHR